MSYQSKIDDKKWEFIVNSSITWYNTLMPVLKHAKKKLRQDVKRTQANKSLQTVFKKLMKKARVAKTKESISAAYKAIDKAAKANIIHANKAARLKSSLVKESTPPPAPKPGARKNAAQRDRANKSTVASRETSKSPSKKK